MFLHLALAQRTMQLAKYGTPLRDQQTAARIPIQAMHELEFFQLRMCRPQCFDDAMTQAAATVHRDAWRFVDDEEIAILIDHCARHELT
jgi:hypothetical protein